MSLTIVAPFVPVTVWVAASQFTSAPRASKMARNGTKVRPCSTVSGTSKASVWPSTVTVGWATAGRMKVKA
ncbi:hypothetical protein SEF58_02320 [Neomoorella humiferrea]|nr:hypothetical protein [Moorella humiferrea]